ncbi:MAG: EscU/YscU/HrcU family type III secretion system export apparatus switch protein [Kofleriaceae bacterium]|nr:EscU/YscU/HrcU family type III secretion system export apparatus switch protein [Kofleriaceae bacterium]
MGRCYRRPWPSRARSPPRRAGSPRPAGPAACRGRRRWSPPAAFAGGALALAATGRAVARAAGNAIAGGVATATGGDPVAAATRTGVPSVLATLAALVALLVVAAAAAAVLAHVAQTWGLWLPRRRDARLPGPRDDAARRAGVAALDLARAVAVAAATAALAGGAAVALATRIGQLAPTTGALGADLAVVLLAQAAAVGVAIGVVDWLERARWLRADLAMTAREARDDRRDAEGDPRWRRERQRRVRDGAGRDEAVRTATVVLVGAGVAAAVAWHPRWQPVPRVVAAARGDRAVDALCALGWRHGVALHGDDPLARALAPAEGALVPGGRARRAGEDPGRGRARGLAARGALAPCWRRGLRAPARAPRRRASAPRRRRRRPARSPAPTARRRRTPGPRRRAAR